MQTQFLSTGSVAYDLEKFAAKRQVRKPKLYVAKPVDGEAIRAKARLFAGLRLAAAIAVVALIVVTMLYSRAMITELTLEIDAASARLNEEISEGTRLTAQLESKMSLRNVEEYATSKLGMVAMDKQQVTYVDLSEGDKIELTGQSPRMNLTDRIALAVNNVKEYAAGAQEQNPAGENYVPSYTNADGADDVSLQKQTGEYPAQD